jgi:flagellar basal-body rod protein FlgB
MSSSLMDDSMKSAAFALDGLSRREEMIGRNIANVDTPGYQAKDVKFEAALETAMNKSGKLALQQTNTAHLASTASPLGMQIATRPGSSWRADGSDVDIDVELTQMADAGVRYQALSQLINKKFLILRNLSVSR